MLTCGAAQCAAKVGDEHEIESALKEVKVGGLAELCADPDQTEFLKSNFFFFFF